MKKANLASNLKRLRMERGYTLEDLSKNLNLDKSSISNYENEKRTPSIEIIDSFARFYNITIDELYGNSDNIKKDVITNDNAITLSFDYMELTFYNKFLRLIAFIFLIISTTVSVFFNNTILQSIYIIYLLLYIVFEFIHLFNDGCKKVKVINLNVDDKLYYRFNENKVSVKKIIRELLINLHVILFCSLLSFGLIITYLTNYLYQIKDIAFISLYFIVLIPIYIFILSKILIYKYKEEIDYKNFMNYYNLKHYKFLIFLNGFLFVFISIILIFNQNAVDNLLKLFTYIFPLLNLIMSYLFLISNYLIIKNYNYYKVNKNNLYYKID